MDTSSVHIGRDVAEAEGLTLLYDEILAVIARTTRKEVTRYKAYGHSNRAQA